MLKSRGYGRSEIADLLVGFGSGGHRLFANFFRLVDQAEEELFLQAGTRRHTLIDQYGVWMPRVEAHVNYVSPIRSGHAVRVRIDPQFKGEKTVRFEFEILDDKTETLHASGYMTVVCVDRATFKAAPIPDEIRNALRGPGAVISS